MKVFDQLVFRLYRSVGEVSEMMSTSVQVISANINYHVLQPCYELMFVGLRDLQHISIMTRLGGYFFHVFIFCFCVQPIHRGKYFVYSKFSSSFSLPLKEC